MSFWKKIFAQENLSSEEKERIDQEKKAKQEEREKQREAKRIEKERQKAAELKKIERFFGSNPGKTIKWTYSIHKDTFQYVENHLITPDETVLGVITAEYDKTKKREINGVLIATEEKMIFAYVRGANRYIEEFEYSKMKGISLVNDGLVSKELYIDYGRGRKKFDDIIDDDQFKKFLSAVNGQINKHRNLSKTKSTKRNPSKVNEGEDKYKQLEQIAKLKEQGILTEEEFQAEKKKILK